MFVILTANPEATNYPWEAIFNLQIGSTESKDSGTPFPKTTGKERQADKQKGKTQDEVPPPKSTTLIEWYQQTA